MVGRTDLLHRHARDRCLECEVKLHESQVLPQGSKPSHCLSFVASHPFPYEMSVHLIERVMELRA